MDDEKINVLIASANSIFRNGILKILSKRADFHNLSIFQAQDIKEVISSYTKNKPKVLIVDYDDKNIKKKLFLNSFLKDQHNAQLLLVSLKQGGNVVFYDRFQLSMDEAHHWLQIPWNENKSLLNSDRDHWRDPK